MQNLERYLDGPLPRAGLLVLGLILFGFGIALSFEGLPAGAIATYGAGVISILFFYLSRFKKIEAFGVKAEAWDQKMQEAADLIDRLQGLSATVASSLFTIVARMGRWGASPTHREQYRMFKDLEEQLRRNDVPEDQIEEAKLSVHRFNMFDLAQPIDQEVTKILGVRAQEKRQEFETIKQPISGDDIPIHAALVEEYRAIDSSEKILAKLMLSEDWRNIATKFEATIRSHSYLEASEKDALFKELSEEFEDLRYYADHGDFRRLEDWLSQDE